MNRSSRWVTHNTRVAFGVTRKQHKALAERGALQRMHHKLLQDCQGPGGCPSRNTIWETSEGNMGFSGSQWHLFASRPEHITPGSAEVTAVNTCGVLGPCWDFPILMCTTCQGRDWWKTMA